MSEVELDARMRGINERVEAYGAEIQAQEISARDYEQRVAMLDDFVAMAEHVSGRLDGVSAEEQTEITHALVSRVTIGEDVQVQLAIGPRHVNDDVGAGLKPAPTRPYRQALAA